jgi:hypothetical protein
MLPIITVGLSAAGRDVAERIAAGRLVTHYASADEAINVLRGADDEGYPIADEEPGGYKAHVLYGDDAFGQIITGSRNVAVPSRVEVLGVRGILTDTMGDSLYKARRMSDGTPEERSVHVQAAQVMQLIRANLWLVVDQLPMSRDWQKAAERQLSDQEDRVERGPVPIDPDAGANAVRELARAQTLKERGEFRPALFEDQNQARYRR